MVRKKILISAGLMKSVNIPDTADAGTIIGGYGGQTLTVAQLRVLLGVTTAPPNTQTPSGSGAGAAGIAELDVAPGLVGGGLLIGNVPLRINKAQAAAMFCGGEDEGGGGAAPPGKRGKDGAIGPTGPAGTPGGKRGPAVALVVEPDEPSPILVRGPRGPVGPQGPSGGGGGGASKLKIWLPSEPDDPPMFVGRAKASSGGVTPATPVPLTIPDLCYWFDASTALAGVTAGVARIDAPNSKPGSPFAPWCAAGPGMQRNASNLNGLPIASFDGSQAHGSYMFPSGATGPLGIFSPAITVFAVFNPAGAGTFRGFMGNNASTQAYQMYLDTSNLIHLDSQGAVGLATTSHAFTAGTAVQMNVSWDQATGAWVTRVSSAADATGTSSATIASFTNGLFWLPNSSSQQFNGLFGDFIIYNRALTLTEKQANEAYLLAKWGV